MTPIEAFRAQLPELDVYVNMVTRACFDFALLYPNARDRGCVVDQALALKLAWHRIKAFIEDEPITEIVRGRGECPDCGAVGCHTIHPPCPSIEADHD